MILMPSCAFLWACHFDWQAAAVTHRSLRNQESFSPPQLYWIPTFLPFLKDQFLKDQFLKSSMNAWRFQHQSVIVLNNLDLKIDQNNHDYEFLT